MATFILRSTKMLPAFTWFCLMLMIHKGAAYEFIVGGQKGWSVQGDSSFNPFDQWVEKSRLQLGDSLVFNYQTGQDSVFYVKSEDYASCNTASPYAEFSDGHTVFKLNQPGPHFFISGNKDNCVKNEKIKIIVLSHKSKSYKGGSLNSNLINNASAPSPSPQSSSSPPSPAPSKPNGPSPSPSPSPDTNQTPSSDHCHPSSNAASSVAVSFTGSVGTFMASVLILSKYV